MSKLGDALRALDAKLRVDSSRTPLTPGETALLLGDALPELAALADAAEALRVLDTSPLYGAHAAWAKDGNSKAARLLEERDERIHVAVTGYDAALAAVLAKLSPATAPEKGDGR